MEACVCCVLCTASARCASVTVMILLCLPRRFLRGKTVDRSRYDQWKDQTQPVSAPDGDEMTDVEVHVTSFAIQGEEEQVHVASFAIVDDDDEQVHVPSNYTDKNEKDSVLLLAKLVPA